jgi:hypothetical protein
MSVVLASGFWVSLADASGVRITGSELMLSPGPVTVEYPSEVLGTTVETADGIIIQQMPSNDPRKRAWIWKGYPSYMPEYQKLYGLISSLRSQTRFSQGLSPFVYLLENITDQFQNLQNASFNLSAGANQATTGTATTGTALVVNAYAGGELEVKSGTGVGQIRYITSNTTGVFTVSSPWTVVPNATSVIVVRWRSTEWFKCRVLDINRKVDESATITKYSETKLVFSVQDTAWNLL